MENFSYAGLKKKGLRILLKSTIGSFVKGIEQHHVREPTYVNGAMHFALERLEIDEVAINEQFLAGGPPLRMAHGVINSIEGEVAVGSRGVRSMTVDGLDLTFDLLSPKAVMQPAATAEEQERQRRETSVGGGGVGGSASVAAGHSAAVSSLTHSIGKDGGNGIGASLVGSEGSAGNGMFSSLLSHISDDDARDLVSSLGAAEDFGGANDGHNDSYGDAEGMGFSVPSNRDDGSGGTAAGGNGSNGAIANAVTFVSQMLKDTVHSLSLTMRSVNIRVRCPPAGREITPGAPLPPGTVELLISLPNEVVVGDNGTNPRDIGNSFKKIIKFSGIRVSVYDATPRAGFTSSAAAAPAGAGSSAAAEEEGNQHHHHAPDVAVQRLSFSDIILSGAVDAVENQITVAFEDTAPSSGLPPKWTIDAAMGQLHVILGPSQLLRLSLFTERLLDAPAVDDGTGRSRAEVRSDRSKVRISVASMSLSVLHDDAVEVVGAAWRAYPRQPLRDALQRVRFYAVRAQSMRVIFYSYSLPTTDADDSYFRVFDRFGGSCVKAEVPGLAVEEHRPGYPRLHLLQLGDVDGKLHAAAVAAAAAAGDKAHRAVKGGAAAASAPPPSTRPTVPAWHFMVMVRTTCPMTARLAREHGVVVGDEAEATHNSSSNTNNGTSSSASSSSVIVRQDIRVQSISAISVTFDVEALERMIQFGKRLEYFVRRSAAERARADADAEAEAELENGGATSSSAAAGAGGIGAFVGDSRGSGADEGEDDGIFSSVYSGYGGQQQQQWAITTSYPTINVGSTAVGGSSFAGGNSNSSASHFSTNNSAQQQPQRSPPQPLFRLLRTASAAIDSLRVRVLFPSTRRPSPDVYGPLTQRLFRQLLVAPAASSSATPSPSLSAAPSPSLPQAGPSTSASASTSSPTPATLAANAGGGGMGAPSGSRGSGGSKGNTTARSTSSGASAAHHQRGGGCHWRLALVIEVSDVAVTLPTGGAERIVVDANEAAVMSVDTRTGEENALLRAALRTPQQQRHMAGGHHNPHQHHQHRQASPGHSRKQRRVLFSPAHTLEIVRRERLPQPPIPSSTSAGRPHSHSNTAAASSAATTGGGNTANSKQSLPYDEPFPAAHVAFRTDVRWQQTEEQEAALAEGADASVFVHIPEVVARLHQDDLLLLLFMTGEVSDCVTLALAALDPIQAEEEGREAMAAAAAAQSLPSSPNNVAGAAAVVPAFGAAVRLVVGSARASLFVPRLGPDGHAVGEPLWMTIPAERRRAMSEDVFYHHFVVGAGGLGLFVYNYEPPLLMAGGGSSPLPAPTTLNAGECSATSSCGEMLVNVRAASVSLDEHLPNLFAHTRLDGFNPPATNRSEPRWGSAVGIVRSYGNLYNKAANNNGERDQTALTVCVRRQLSVGAGVSNTIDILLDRLSLSHQSAHEGDHWLLALLAFVGDAPEVADRSDDDEDDNNDTTVADSTNAHFTNHSFVDNSSFAVGGGLGSDSAAGLGMSHSGGGGVGGVGGIAYPATIRTRVALVAKDSLVQYQPYGFVCRLAVLAPTIAVDTGALLSTQKRAVISVSIDEATAFLHNDFRQELLEYDASPQSLFGVTQQGVAGDLANLGFISVLSVRSHEPPPGSAAATASGGGMGMGGFGAAADGFGFGGSVRSSANFSGRGGPSGAQPMRYGVNSGSAARPTALSRPPTDSPHYYTLSDPLLSCQQFLGGRDTSPLSGLPHPCLTLRMYDVAGKPIVVELSRLAFSLSCARDSFYLLNAAVSHYVGGLDLAFLPSPMALVCAATADGGGGGGGGGRRSGSSRRSGATNGRKSGTASAAGGSAAVPPPTVDRHPKLESLVAAALQRSIFDTTSLRRADGLDADDDDEEGDAYAMRVGRDDEDAECFEYIRFDAHGAEVRDDSVYGEFLLAGEEGKNGDDGGNANAGDGAGQQQRRVGLGVNDGSAAHTVGMGVRRQIDAYALAGALASRAAAAPVTIPSADAEDDSFEIIGHASEAVGGAAGAEGGSGGSGGGPIVERKAPRWTLSEGLQRRLDDGQPVLAAREGIRAEVAFVAAGAGRGGFVYQQRGVGVGGGAAGGASVGAGAYCSAASAVNFGASAVPSSSFFAGANNVVDPNNHQQKRMDLRDLVETAGANHFSLANPLVRQGDDGSAEADARLHDCPQVAVEVRVRDCSAVARLYGGLDFKGVTVSSHQYQHTLIHAHSMAVFTGDPTNPDNVSFRPTRPKNVSIEAQLFGIGAHVSIFVPGMAKAMQLSLRVRDARVLDHIGSSNVRTVLMCSVPATHRDNDGNLFEMRWVSSTATFAGKRSVPMEDISVRLQPLTLNVHRRNIDLVDEFLNVTPDILVEVLQVDARPSDLFFRRLFIHPLSITLNVTTEAKELGQALRGTAPKGSLYEFANLLPSIEGSQISLGKIEILNTPISMLAPALLDAIGSQLFRFQPLLLLFCGFEVVRTVNEAGTAVGELVIRPLEHWRRNRSVAAGLAKGFSGFGRRIGAEVFRIGSATTRTGQLVTGAIAGGAPMARGAQPSGAREGLAMAGGEVRRGAEDVYARICFALCDEGAGAAAAQIPTAPFVMTDSVLRAATHALEGIRNSIRPEQWLLNNRLYKARVDAPGTL